MVRRVARAIDAEWQASRASCEAVVGAGAGPLGEAVREVVAAVEEGPPSLPRVERAVGRWAGCGRCLASTRSPRLGFGHVSPLKHD